MRPFLTPDMILQCPALYRLHEDEWVARPRSKKRYSFGVPLVSMDGNQTIVPQLSAALAFPLEPGCYLIENGFVDVIRIGREKLDCKFGSVIDPHSLAHKSRSAVPELSGKAVRRAIDKEFLTIFWTA